MDAEQIARSLTPWWRALFLSLPGDGSTFAKPTAVKQNDSAIRRGFWERTGTVVDGCWQYRLTPLGLAVRAILKGDA